MKMRVEVILLVVSSIMLLGLTDKVENASFVDNITNVTQSVDKQQVADEVKNASFIENVAINTPSIEKQQIAENTACPAGFTYSIQASLCFMAVSQRVTWFTAQIACAAWAPGAHLAVLRTQHESYGLADYLRRFQSNAEFKCKPGFYIGSQRTINGDCKSGFIWKPYPHQYSHMNYTNWDAGEPNCNKNTDESCAVIRYMDDHGVSYTWNDYSCHDSLCYVCQYRGV